MQVVPVISVYTVQYNLSPVQWNILQRQIQVGYNYITYPLNVWDLIEFCHHPGDWAVRAQGQLQYSSSLAWILFDTGLFEKPLQGLPSLIQEFRLSRAAQSWSLPEHPWLCLPCTLLIRTRTLSSSPLDWLQTYVITVNLPGNPWLVSWPWLLLCSALVWLLWCWALVSEATALPALLSPWAPSLPSLMEQKAISAAWS